MRLTQRGERLAATGGVALLLAVAGLAGASDLETKQALRGEVKALQVQLAEAEAQDGDTIKALQDKVEALRAEADLAHEVATQARFDVPLCEEDEVITFDARCWPQDDSEYVGGVGWMSVDQALWFTDTASDG